LRYPRERSNFAFRITGDVFEHERRVTADTDGNVQIAAGISGLIFPHATARSDFIVIKGRSS